RTALDKSFVYTPDSKGDIGEMYFTLGFEELSLAENFCNGIPMSYTVDAVPIYTKPLTNDSIFKIALTHFDSALTLAAGTDAKSVAVKQGASIAKARALVDLGQISSAALLVSATTIPTTYQYLLTFDLTTGDNTIWALNNSMGRYTVSDSVDNITGV